MQSGRYQFDRPEDVSRFMVYLFTNCLPDEANSFSFELLQSAGNIEIRCEDRTEEKAVFAISPELLKAIHKCERVTAPETPGLPDDWNFAGFMETATYQVLRQVSSPPKSQLFDGPLFSTLYYDVLLYPDIKGVRIFHLRHNHWSCIIRDRSSVIEEEEEEEDRQDYLRKSEILAVISIFFRQMNETVWLPERELYRPRLTYKEGHLTATIVTFIYKKVRVVQATINPSDRYPTLTLTLRAIYTLSEKEYDVNIALDVLKWILSPPELGKQLTQKGKEKEVANSVYQQRVKHVSEAVQHSDFVIPLAHAPADENIRGDR